MPEIDDVKQGCQPFHTCRDTYCLPRAGLLVATGEEPLFKVHLGASGGGPREENLSSTTLSVWKFLTWGFNDLLWARSRTSLSSLSFGPSQANLFVTNLFTSGPVSSSESSLLSELVYSKIRNFLHLSCLASSQPIWSTAETRRAIFWKTQDKINIFASKNCLVSRESYLRTLTVCLQTV